MTIQKIFSEVGGEEKYYSVLMNEGELRLFAFTYGGLSGNAARQKFLEDHGQEAYNELMNERSQAARSLMNMRNKANQALNDQVSRIQQNKGAVYRDTYNEISSMNSNWSKAMKGKGGPNPNQFTNYYVPQNAQTAAQREAENYVRTGTQNALKSRSEAYRKALDNVNKDMNYTTEDIIKDATKRKAREADAAAQKLEQEARAKARQQAAMQGQEKEKQAAGFISRNWNKLGTGGKIGVAAAGTAAIGGLGYGAYKMMNKDKK